jgi:hypothetical protein
VPLHVIWPASIHCTGNVLAVSVEGAGSDRSGVVNNGARGLDERNGTDFDGRPSLKLYERLEQAVW